MLPAHLPSGSAGSHLLPRQADGQPAMDLAAAECQSEPVELGRQGLRIASIFIILVASLIGALLPILLARQSRMHVPKSAFFICKFVGTGVIIATAWMHLLAPAIEQLGDKCVALTWPAVASYPWALCIPLMTIMVMFLVELLASTSGSDEVDGSASDSELDHGGRTVAKKNSSSPSCLADDAESARDTHSRSSVFGEEESAACNKADGQNRMAGRLTSIFILEFGVVFHSVFIGLTLGTTANDELVILFIVLVFHQMFEGLGLGSRLALAPWPRGRGWVPYALALGFGLSTPIGIAAGMGAKPSNAATQKLVNGLFDSISAGILMYTGLVELLAHEFMFNPHMRRALLRVKLGAFACVAMGVAVMALLAKWA